MCYRPQGRLMSSSATECGTDRRFQGDQSGDSACVSAHSSALLETVEMKCGVTRCSPPGRPATVALAGIPEATSYNSATIPTAPVPTVLAPSYRLGAVRLDVRPDAGGSATVSVVSVMLIGAASVPSTRSAQLAASVVPLSS